MTIKRMFGTCAVGMVAAVSAGSVWLGGAGTALAPEPAVLRATLGSYSSSVPAVYRYSSTPTNVVRWPASPAPGGPAAGTPCSTVALSEGEQTSRVIRRSGSNAYCY